MLTNETPHANHARDRFGLISLTLLVLFLLQGCALGGGSRRTGGSGLSQAAEEAKKEPEEQKKLKAGRVVEEQDDEEVDHRETIVIVERDAPPPSSPVQTSVSEVAHDRPPTPKSIYRRFHLGVVGGPGMLTGDNFGGYGAGGLQVGGFPGPRWRADVSLLGIGTNFSETSGLNQSFKGEHEMALDVSTRYYLTKEHTFVGAYPVVGLRFGTLNWDYANPILIEENGTRRVASDELVYFSPYVGLGTSIVQTRHFHLGAQVIGGGRFYRRYTHEGLVNDLFNDGGFVQLMFEATVPF